MRIHLLRTAACLRFSLLPLLLILGSHGARAQTLPAPQSVDLADALSAAYSRDPQVALLSEQVDQAQAGIALANGLTPGPGAVSLNHLNDRLQRNQGRREWEVEVATPLWLPGQRSASLRQATQALAELQARLALRRLALAGELRETWWQVAQARTTRDLAGHRLQTAEALELAVHRRYQKGDLARVDANLARTERLNAQSEALEADAALLQAQQAYSALTGIQPPPDMAPEHVPLEKDGTTTEPEAHPQWQALQGAVTLADSRLALVDSLRRDAPELALRWTTQRSDAFAPYDQAVGIKLTVPLSSGDRARQDSAGARAELAQAEREMSLFRTRLDQAVLRAQRELSTAQTQNQLATQRRELTADNLKLAQRAFDLGEQDLPSLLRARSADLEAQAWLNRQRIALHAAMSHLLQAQGRLPQATLAQPQSGQTTTAQP